MLKIIALVIVLAFAVILTMALTKPAGFRVERSATIAASPARITPLLSDFHNWDQWSPWARLDPAMRTTYSGPASGPGAVYEWEGNSKVGKGRMEILDVKPAETRVKLDFLKPFEGHNMTEFHLEPTAALDGSGSTRVRWVMYGPNTFMGKLMSVFTSMDHMIGPDFERGLTNLKAAAER